MELLRVGAEQFRRRLSELLGRVGYGNDRVIVEKNGTPLAVVISYEEYRQLIEERQPDSRTAADSLMRLQEKLADIDYDEFAAGLQRERLRTLKELYPDYYEKYVKDRDVAVESA